VPKYLESHELDADQVHAPCFIEGANQKSPHSREPHQVTRQHSQYTNVTKQSSKSPYGVRSSKISSESGFFHPGTSQTSSDAVNSHSYKGYSASKSPGKSYHPRQHPALRKAESTKMSMQLS